MKSTAIFIAFFVILGASATNIDFSSFAEVAATPFAKSVVSMMQMNMQSEGTLDTIENLLTKILGQLQTAQKKSDADNKEDNAECSTNQQDLKSQIKSFEATIAADEQNKATAESSLAKAQTKLAVTEKNLAEDEAALKKLRIENEAALAAYAKKVTSLEKAEKACDKALALLGTLQNKAMFAELSGSVDELQAVLAELGGFESEFQPILTALAQLRLGAKADQAVLNQLIDLISRLRTSLRAELAQSKSNEADRKIRVAKEDARLTASIAQLKNTRRTTKKTIAALESQIAALTRNLKKTRPLLRNAQDQLATEIQRCKALNTLYKKNKNIRTGEIAVTKKLQAHFQKTLAKTSQDIRKLTGA